jgi:hypothetical protein
LHDVLNPLVSVQTELLDVPAELVVHHLRAKKNTPNPSGKDRCIFLLFDSQKNDSHFVKIFFTSVKKFLIRKKQFPVKRPRKGQRPIGYQAFYPLAQYMQFGNVTGCNQNLERKGERLNG